MGLFDIFKRKAAPITASEPVSKPKPKEIWYPFSEWVTFGGNVNFIDEKTGAIKPIIKDRVIVNFPGFDEDDKAKWMHMWTSENEPVNCIRYRTEFYRRNGGGYTVHWEIQPDGQYWADEDGYGMTNDAEIVLYAEIDENGSFKSPFKLFSIGRRRFAPKPGEEGLSVEEIGAKYTREMFDGKADSCAKYISETGEDEIIWNCRDWPGTEDWSGTGDQLTVFLEIASFFSEGERQVSVRIRVKHREMSNRDSYIFKIGTKAEIIEYLKSEEAQKEFNEKAFELTAKLMEEIRRKL